MKQLLTVSLRAPRRTLAVMIALTAVFGFFAPALRVDSAIENLLPAHDPDKLYYDRAKKTFGDEAITVIGIFGDDVFSPATLAKIDRLSDAVARIDGVREVISVTTVPGIEMGPFGLSTGRLMRELPRTASEAAAFRSRVLSNPLYLKNVVSADGRAAGISVVFEPISDEEFISRGIEPQIRAAAAEIEGPETVAITGIPTLKVQSALLMEGDIAKFLPFGVLIAVAVLTCAFRTLRGVLLPLATVLAGVVWTTGLMVLTDTPINMGTLVLPPLLIAVGIAYAIHFMSRYYQELRPDRPPAEVVAAMLDHVLIPAGIAALTTLIGFATFILTPIRAIREFGTYAVFGIAAVFVLTVTILPATLVLLPSPKRGGHRDADASWLTRLLSVLGENAVRRSAIMLFAGLLICAGSAWGIGRVPPARSQSTSSSMAGILRRSRNWMH
jgi:predicted RND superfamily exporter protein